TPRAAWGRPRPAAGLRRSPQRLVIAVPPSAALKLALTLHGVRIEPAAAAALGSPALGTIDLRLPGSLRVAATPVDAAPWMLTHGSGQYTLRSGAGSAVAATVVP